MSSDTPRTPTEDNQPSTGLLSLAQRIKALPEEVSGSNPVERRSYVQGCRDTRTAAAQLVLNHAEDSQVRQADPVVDAEAPDWRYGSELMKILKAAWTGDTKLATAYANLMADKMEQDGHPGAKWLRQHVEVLNGQREAVVVRALASQPDSSGSQEISG